MMIKKYKSTSLGIIPKNWDIKTVEQLVKENILDKPLDGNHGERHPVSSDYVLSGIPFIMASDIKDFMIDFNDCKYIKKSQADTLLKGFSKEGDILLTHKATIGNVAFVKNIPSEYIMLTPQVTYYRVLDENKLSRKYLMYYFRTQVFQDLLKMWAGSGSTRAYIGITKQLKLPIILPPIEEQLKIVHQLDVYDQLIDNNNKRIVLLEKMAQEIYKEWFVRMRFPGYESTKFIKGIPVEWEEVKLSELANIVMGQSPSSEFYNDIGDGLPFHQGVSDFNFRFPNNTVYCSQIKKIANKGDILFSVRAPVGRLNIAASRMVIGRGLAAIRHKQEYNCYLYYALQNIFFKEDIMGNGSIFNSITKNELESIKILTSKELQYKFNQFVEQIDKEIEILIKKNDNFMKTREFLLPRLMSGKFQLSN